MDTPLISIVMATYNGEKYLKKQLDSIYAQTYENIELIVSDDGSFDETVLILKEYAELYGLKYKVNEINLGFKKNFETAIECCSGEYIAFSDQDDIWLPEKLQVLMSNIDNNDLACSDMVLIDETDKVISRSWHRQANFRLCDNDDIFIYLLFRNFVTGCASLVKKSLVDKYLPIPETEKYHDYWFAVCAAKENGVVYVPEKLVLYRQHPRQDTGSGDINYGVVDTMKAILRSVFLRAIRKENSRLLGARLQKERLRGLLEIEFDLFDQYDKKVIEDVYAYNKNRVESFIHLRSLLMSIKYSRIIYGKNYFYYKSFILDFIG